MADTVAGIAPQTDTYANWVIANPTLGKDSGGKSFSQFIFATASPVGTILIWGNDQTFTTAYAAKQYIVMSANTLMSKFNGTWSSTSTWTSGASIIINHGLTATFDELFGFIFIRDDSATGKIYNVTNFEWWASGTYLYGSRLQGIDGDSANCYLQIGSTGPRYMTDAGRTAPVPVTAWTYKVVMYKLS